MYVPAQVRYCGVGGRRKLQVVAYMSGNGKGAAWSLGLANFYSWSFCLRLKREDSLVVSFMVPLDMLDVMSRA